MAPPAEVARLARRPGSKVYTREFSRMDAQQMSSMQRSDHLRTVGTVEGESKAPETARQEIRGWAGGVRPEGNHNHTGCTGDAEELVKARDLARALQLRCEQLETQLVHARHERTAAEAARQEAEGASAREKAEARVVRADKEELERVVEGLRGKLVAAERQAEDSAKRLAELLECRQSQRGELQQVCVCVCVCVSVCVCVCVRV